ncbi:MAG: D-amino-acid transaminase [Balneolales bacterium]
MLVYLNGRFLPKKDANISVDDRGFVFGDGVYEVIRVVDGKLFLAKPHMDRLKDGLAGLEIQVDENMVHNLMSVAESLIKKNDLLKGHGTVYLQITRGVAKRIHNFPAVDVQPTIYLSTSGFKPDLELQKNGAQAITMSDIRWMRCDLKTINLLPNVLAKQKAMDAGAFTSVFIRDGVVTEGQNANIFGVKNGVLRTYPRTNYILPGITRALVLEMANEENIVVDQTPINEDELLQMDEIFLTGTTTDIQPIISIDGKQVGNGKRGNIARLFQDLLHKRMTEIPSRTA